MRYIVILFLFQSIINAQELKRDSIEIEIDSTENKMPTEYADGSPIYDNDQKIIYFNPRKNVSVFFPETIRQAITGSENVTFSYNTENPQFFGILKGIKSSESNLLVITTDGQVYSFLLKYMYEIPNQNYFINASESIGNENPALVEKSQSQNSATIDIPTEMQQRSYDPNSSDFETVNYLETPKDTSNLIYTKDRIDFMRRYSYNLTWRANSRGISEKEGKIKLSLLSINYKYNEMYFTMEIENNSGVDYDINLLDISIANSKRKKRKSAQTLLKKPIFTYQLEDRIERKTKQRIVYVIPKFSINDEKKVIIELNELGGERNITLDIPQRDINNPE